MSLTRGALALMVLCCLTLNIAKSDQGNTKTDKESETKGCGLTKATTTRNTSNVRIIPAKEAEKGAWPWMAEVYQTKGNKKSAICGGALLNEFYVITSAHCVVNRREVTSASDLTIRLGEHDLENDKDGMKPVNANVTSINAHEEFNPVTFDNDIALLRLEHPVTFSNHIQPICLPDESVTELDFGSMRGYVAGWGITSQGGNSSNVLKEMSAIIVDDESCQEAYEEKAVITDVHICTVGVNGSSPCSGFGGGPLMVPGEDNRYYILGIVSFGVGCGNPDYPDVYTKVSEFMDWIREYVK